MQGRKLEPLTEDQLTWIRANIANMFLHDIAARLGMSARSLRRILKEQEIKGPRAHRDWTDADTEMLRQLAPTHYVRSIAIEMSRDPSLVRKNARRLGIKVLSWESDCASAREDYVRMVNDGLTMNQIAARTGKTYNSVHVMLRKLGLRAKPDPRARIPGNSIKEKSVTVALDRTTPKAEPPRERVGLPIAIRRGSIAGTVKYCERCFCPVVDRPERWAEHNAIVHSAPVFPVPCISRRNA